MTDFIFLGSKIIVDSDCNRKIKKHLILERKSYNKPRHHTKKQRHHFANKGPYKAMVFQQSCMDVRVGPLSRLSTEEFMLSHYGAGEDSCESLGLQGDQTSQSQRN